MLTRELLVPLSLRPSIDVQKPAYEPVSETEHLQTQTLNPTQMKSLKLGAVSSRLSALLSPHFLFICRRTLYALNCIADGGVKPLTPMRWHCHRVSPTSGLELVSNLIVPKCPSDSSILRPILIPILDDIANTLNFTWVFEV